MGFIFAVGAILAGAIGNIIDSLFLRNDIFRELLPGGTDVP
jgi:lipoprotein signal peptidase